MSAQPAHNQNSANQPHIFLDLDGVLADFKLHAKQEGKLDPAGKVKNELLDYQWWSTMPAFDGAKAFYDTARKIGIVKFLTGPIENEECFSGKAHWVQDFVPERGTKILKDLIICASKDKAYLARPNHILIDDRISNINAWQAAGGIGIHHTGDFAATLRQLQDAAAKLAAPIPAPAKKSRLHRLFPGLH